MRLSLSEEFKLGLLFILLGILMSVYRTGNATELTMTASLCLLIMGIELSIR